MSLTHAIESEKLKGFVHSPANVWPLFKRTIENNVIFCAPRTHMHGFAARTLQLYVRTERVPHRPIRRKSILTVRTDVFFFFFSFCFVNVNVSHMHIVVVVIWFSIYHLSLFDVGISATMRTMIRRRRRRCRVPISEQSTCTLGTFITFVSEEAPQFRK